MQEYMAYSGGLIDIMLNRKRIFFENLEIVQGAFHNLGTRRMYILGPTHSPHTAKKTLKIEQNEYKELLTFVKIIVKKNTTFAI